MKCRGMETRRRIVEEYEVKPIAHLKLLVNQTKYSDAEATIEDEYYIFIATHNKYKYKETIQCGMGAAKDFLKLIHQKGLPIFNPLKEERAKSSSKDCQSNEDTVGNNWDPTAKQLYNASMWLIIMWNAQPDTPLFSIAEEVFKMKENSPSNAKIKSLNTIIRKGGKGKKLTEIIDGYRKDNVFKSSICKFDLLDSRIKRMTDENGMKIKSFF